MIYEKHFSVIQKNLVPIKAMGGGRSSILILRYTDSNHLVSVPGLVLLVEESFFGISLLE